MNPTIEAFMSAVINDLAARLAEVKDITDQTLAAVTTHEVQP